MKSIPIEEHLYIRLQIMNTEQGNAIATEYEYWDRAASIVIVYSYSRSVVYQAMTSIIQEVVTMVTANEKYSLLKSTYIRLQTNYEHN